MKIGYLHLGHSQHGIYRYGCLLASEAKSRSSLDVIEASVNWSGGLWDSTKALLEAARRLSRADVVHLQFNVAIWGGRPAHYFRLWTFLQACRSPVVVTLHDLLQEPSSLDDRRRVESAPRAVLARKGDVGAQRGATSIGGGTEGGAANRRRSKRASPALIFRILRQARTLIAFSKANASFISGMNPAQDVEIITHFVEDRRVAARREEARKALGLEDGRTVSVLGFIHRRKGHALLVEAMPSLPQDVRVVLIGRPALSQQAERYVMEFRARAEALGVADRLRVTGYVSEEELERYLVATDLAVCPFFNIAASGSLSTWISVPRPILASDLPGLEDYNQLVPGSIKTYRPQTAEALAAAINHYLPDIDGGLDPRMVQLREKLLLPVIFDRHVQVYRKAFESSRKGKDAGL